MKQLDTLILAIQLLTRIPIKKQVAVKDDTLVNGVVFWPLIGLMTGLIQLCVYGLCSLIMGRPAAAVFTVLAQIFVNGGFHLDGLCDTADGIYSARTRERMLEIMKDSRIGTNGVIAAFFDILLKITLLIQLSHPVIPILLMPAAGKFVQGVLLYKATYARKNGLGNAYIGKISFRIFMMITLTGTVGIALILVLFAGPWLILVPVLCLLFAFGFRKYIEAKLGGLTGDILGAGSELTEIFFLVLIGIADHFLFI